MGKNLSIDNEDEDIMQTTRKNREKKPKKSSSFFQKTIKKNTKFVPYDESKFNFQIEYKMPGLENNVNYGKIPLNLLHSTFLFLERGQVYIIMQTCKLFLGVVNTSLFWQEYLENNDKKAYNKIIIDHEKKDKKLFQINWKKEFYMFLCYSNFDYECNIKYKAYRGKDRIKDNDTKLHDDDLPCKTVLLGETNTGKSSFLVKLVMDKYDEDIEPTIGAAFMSFIIERRADNKKIKFDIWDTSGNQRYKSLAPMYYRGASSILVFFSFDEKVTFTKAKEWVREIRRQAKRKCKIILLGLKCDIKERKRKITRKEIMDYIEEERKTIKPNEEELKFFEVSPKNNINIIAPLCTLFEFISKNESEKNEKY